MLIAIIAAIVAAAGGGGGLWYWLRQRKPPTPVTALHSVTLTWKPGADGPGVYNVYRDALVPKNSSTKLNSTPLTVLTYIDTTAVVGVEYFYTVTELINGIESLMSNVETVTIPLAK